MCVLYCGHGIREKYNQKMVKQLVAFSKINYTGYTEEWFQLCTLLYSRVVYRKSICRTMFGCKVLFCGLKDRGCS